MKVMSYNIHHGVGVDNVLDHQRIADLITEKQVLQSTYSDHLPIIVDLELERSAPYLNGN
ncbi:endonuclease/exonuclease/phosphatase family protein [Neobacillus drentensis]|uniref:endonuclease/exonuclease/phosphatase family protein n=1 Tax=Neobacillus drentensis TaxID=220684 RepID=UPI002FFE6947